MIRQRALAWAAILALVATVSIAALPSQLAAPAALAQDTAADEASEPTDLAVVALHCAEAPAAEALASYFATGTPPAGCAPAVGVAVAVTENEAALPGSPFATDVAGSLVVGVGLGSAVEVREDPESLPAGYEPLAGEANGVPYANPVRLDSAVAGAAVLFVNVPAPVAALAQEAAAAAAGEPTDLAEAGTPNANAAAQAAVETPASAPTADKTGCDLAYADERNVTTQPADLRKLDANGDGIGAESVPPTGGTILNGANVRLNASVSDAPRAATGDGNVARFASAARFDAGVWKWPAGHNRVDGWLWRSDRDAGHDWRLHGGGLWVWSGAGNLAVSGSALQFGNGVWFWPAGGDRGDDWFWTRRISTGNLTVARSGNGNLAIVSNPVHIGSGVWFWPGRDQTHDWLWPRQFGRGVWTWPDRDHTTWLWPGRFGAGHIALAKSGSDNLAVSGSSVRFGNGVWFWPDGRAHLDWLWPARFGIGNLAAARSGNGSFAVSGNFVRLGSGLWLWPSGRNGVHDWRVNGSGLWWPSDRDRFLDWRMNGNGVWIWSGAVARSSSGSLAVSGNAVRIGTGIWGWPGRSGNGVWVWSGAIARSSSGSVAISGSWVRLGSGVWRLPPDRDRGDDWLMHDGAARADGSSGEPLSVDGGLTVAPAPSKLEQASGSAQPPLTLDDGLAVTLPADAVQPPSDNTVAPPSDGTVESLTDLAVQPPPVAAAPDPGYVDAGIDAGIAAPAPVDLEQGVDSGSVDPGADPGYVAPAPVNTDPGYVAPDPAYVDPSYVAPDPAYVDPGYVAPDPVYVEPAYVAPDPNYVDPSYVAPDPAYVDPAYAEPAYVEPAYVAPDPVNVAPAFGDSGSGDFGSGDFGNGVPEPVNVDPVFVAPDPVNVGFNNGDAGVDFGNGGPGTFAPEPVNVEPNFVAQEPVNAAPNFVAPDPVIVAPDPGNGDFGNSDFGNGAPDLDVGGSERGQEDE